MMRSIAFVVLLTVEVAICEKMKAFRYMAVGYDIFQANPLITGSDIDPGFRNMPLFNFTYDNQLLSEDSRWEIPDNTTVLVNEECSLKFNTRIATGTQKYLEVLNSYVDSTFDYLDGHFKGSYDYKQVKDHTSQGAVYTTSHAECNAYTAVVRTHPWPAINEDFKKDVANLPVFYDEGDYMQFLLKYGTHFVYMINMGAKLECVTRLSKESWIDFLFKGYEAREGIAGSCYDYTGAVERNISYNKDAINAFRTDSKEIRYSARGPRPVRGGNWNFWLNAVKENPMPVSYKLKRIADLMYDSIMSHVNNLDMIRENVIKALDKYCSYLQSKNIVSNCAHPPPDPPIPTLKRSCRLCSSSCGGDFPLKSGAYRNYGNPVPYTSYDRDCKSPFSKYTIPGYTYMCCQQDAEHQIGSCRVCNQCGGQYTESMGKVHYADGNVRPNILSYDNSCGGELRDYGVNVKPSLCCKKTAICSLCLSCGNEYPEEEGVFYKSLTMHFEGKGDKCKSNYNGQPGILKVCCRTAGTRLTE